MGIFVIRLNQQYILFGANMKSSKKKHRIGVLRFSVFAVLSAISQLSAGVELLTNGDFEAGTGANATGWSVITSAGFATMQRSNVALTSCCATVPVAPIAGYSMMTTQTGSSGSAAYQTIAIPQNARSLTFSASVVGNFSTTSGDISKIDILAASANPLTGTALQTIYVRNGTQGNQTITTITVPVTGLNGQTVMLRLYTFASSNPNMFAFDNISLSAIVASVYGSSQAQSNTPAYGAANVIDTHANLQNLFNNLATDQQISGAATQTLPILFGASSLVAQNVLASVNHVIQARIDANRGQSSGDEIYSNQNVWMKPFGSWADQSERNGVAGYKANTYGLALGVDGTALSSALRIGGAFAYARADINGQSNVAPQSADVDVFQLISYGSYNLNERTAIDFQFDAGQNNNKGQRQIAFTSSVASSNFSSRTAHAGVALGRTYPLNSQTSLTPSVRADYTWIRDNAYNESGAGLLNLSVSSRNTEAFVIGIDSKLAHKLNDRTTLIANLGVGYDTINKQAAITSTFAGAPEAAFVTYGIDPSPWLARGGLGAVYKIKDNLEITGRYDAEYRESFLNQTASVKARWAF